VITAPELPFGWLDGPPGVNRLIGADWLSMRLSGDTDRARIHGSVREFYTRFYQIRLSDAALSRLLDGAA
jgi:iron complex transport system substrate-binding protein